MFVEKHPHCQTLKAFAKWKEEVEQVIGRENGYGALPLDGFNFLSPTNRAAISPLENEIDVYDFLKSAKIVIMTKQRTYAVEKIEEIVLAAQTNKIGEKVLSLPQNTQAFFPFVKDAFFMLSRWSNKFDLLFAFTFILIEHKCHIYFKRMGCDILCELHSMWKLVLVKSDKILGIDSEYTRPGVVHLLETLYLK